MDTGKDAWPPLGGVDVVRGYGALLRPHSSRVLLMAVLTLGLESLMLLDPWAVSRVVNQHLPERDLAGALPLLAALVASLAVGTLISVVVSRIGARLATTVAGELREKVWDMRFRLPARLLERSRQGEGHVLLSDADFIAYAVTSTLPSIISLSTLTIVATVGLLWFDARIMLATLGVAVPTMAVFLYAMRRRVVLGAKRHRAHQRLLEHCDRWLESDAVLLARQYAVGGLLRARFQRGSDTVGECDRRIIGARDQTFVLGELSVAVMRVSTIVLALWLGVSPGTFVAILYLQLRVLIPVREILAQLSNAAETLDALRDVTALDARQRERTGGRRLLTVDGALRFEDVGVVDDGWPRISGFSADTRAGERIALVGGSGAGKTTIGKLAAALLDPDVGTVRLDGVDLRELDPAWVREQVGYQTQAPYLFEASVRDNITLGREATDERLRQVLRIAAADELVARLPAGLETGLGPRGLTLSGGQAQRLDLARRLLIVPPVLVLDEPTSELDDHTADAVLANLDEATSGITLLLITHRAPPAWVDRVIRLPSGAV